MRSRYDLSTGISRASKSTMPFSSRYSCGRGMENNLYSAASVNEGYTCPELESTTSGIRLTVPSPSGITLACPILLAACSKGSVGNKNSS
jgi:hypothetical protein